MLNYRCPNDQVLGNSLKHAISRLFKYDPEHRLRHFGASEVMERPWLSHVDWTWMRNRVYELKVPNLKVLFTHFVTRTRRKRLFSDPLS